MKKFAILIAMILSVLALSVIADSDCIDGVCDGSSANTSTLDVSECLVRINDRKLNNDVTILKAFDRGEELEIRVEFTSRQDAEDVQVIALITGYHRGHKFTDQIFDITPTFDVEEDVSYEKTLRLRLPEDFDLDTGDELKVRIEIEDKFSNSYVKTYNLKVEALRNRVVVDDIVLDPSTEVQAGRGLFASVRVKNWGEDDEEDLKITAAIPALGLKATEYIDELEADDATTSEDMFLRIPSCAEPGKYTVSATVEYADGDEEATEETTITVLEDPACETSTKPTNGNDDKTVVSVPGKQDIIKGTSGTVFPIVLENRGFTDRSYELKATGLDSWATYRFDPGSFTIVKAGESKTVYLYVAANEDATTGEKVFMVSVATQGDSKQIAITANVVEGDTQTPLDDLGPARKYLEWGLIGLVVLVIILGLIIVFNKLKGNDDEPEEVSGQTYY